MNRHKLYESSSARSQTINLIMNTLDVKAIATKMKFDKDAVNQIKMVLLIEL